MLAGRDFEHARYRRRAAGGDDQPGALARIAFPGQDPLGKQIEFEWSGGPLQVVGVAADENTDSLDTGIRPVVYFPELQGGAGVVNIVVRAGGAPAALNRAIRDEVRALDPEVSGLSDEDDGGSDRRLSCYFYTPLSGAPDELVRGDRTGDGDRRHVRAGGLLGDAAHARDWHTDGAGSGQFGHSAAGGGAGNRAGHGGGGGRARRRRTAQSRANEAVVRRRASRSGGCSRQCRGSWSPPRSWRATFRRGVRFGFPRGWRWGATSVVPSQEICTSDVSLCCPLPAPCWRPNRTTRPAAGGRMSPPWPTMGLRAATPEAKATGKRRRTWSIRASARRVEAGGREGLVSVRSGCMWCGFGRISRKFRWYGKPASRNSTGSNRSPFRRG